jgi:hypothetical protein
VLLLAASAFAGSVPEGSVVHVDRAIDLAAFARTIATRYQVVVERAAAADIDRDGDLDVLTATDRGFLVWVNDGNGRLTSQQPNPKSGLDGRPSGDMWSGERSGHNETIQNDAPSTKQSATHAHAPPPSGSDAPAPPVSSGRSCLRSAAHIPRAPPYTLL